MLLTDLGVSNHGVVLFFDDKTELLHLFGTSNSLQVLDPCTVLAQMCLSTFSNPLKEIQKSNTVYKIKNIEIN